MRKGMWLEIDEEYYESEGGGTYGSEDGGDYYIPD